MLTVYKYPLSLDDDVTLALPEGAQVLTIQMQNGDPVLWALVNPDAPTEQRSFHITGTGHSIEEPRSQWRYVATFQMLGGALVFHVFEQIKAARERVEEDT